MYSMERASQVVLLVKNLPANAGDSGSIPGLGRSPGEGNGDPLQYSCLGSPMDRGSCWATVHGVSKSHTRLKQLSVCTHTHTHTPCEKAEVAREKPSLLWRLVLWRAELRALRTSYHFLAGGKEDVCTEECFRMVQVCSSKMSL